MDHDCGQLWHDLVATLLSACWSSYDSGRMARQSQRPPVGATFFCYRGTALVYHFVGFCFNYARGTARRQVGPPPSTCCWDCSRCAVSGCAIGPAARVCPRRIPSSADDCLFVTRAATGGRTLLGVS